MVITYSIEELHNIGNMLALKQCLEQNSNISIVKNVQDYEESLLHLQQQLHMLGHPVQVMPKPPIYADQLETMISTTTNRNQPLASSVAEFFKKAKQNFHPEINIDPTKVRRLSEVEAELISECHREYR